jgi:hypothetical protein
MVRPAWALSWFIVATVACVSRSASIYPEVASRIGPADDDPRGSSCRDSHECSAGTYCSQPGCDGKGRCTLKPTITREVFRPVCGCNARVYGNDDTAHQEGLSVSHYLVRGEASGRDCEPHFVCREGEPVVGVDCHQ